MSVVDDLVAAYRHRVNLPLRSNLSPAERVWIAVYPPEQERRLRHRLDELAIVTSEAGLAWRTVDVPPAIWTTPSPAASQVCCRAASKRSVTKRNVVPPTISTGSLGWWVSTKTGPPW